MSNRFHNKFHRHNHHTDPTNRESLYPDSAYDPIASYESPFRGDFFLSGNLIGYKSAYITDNLFVSGEVTRLDTNVYITSATNIYIANTEGYTTPALKVTQFSVAPIAQFFGTEYRETGEYSITFNEIGEVGIGTTDPQGLLHVKQNSPSKDGVIKIESVSQSSILKLESFDRGAIHFINYAEPAQDVYAIIEGDQDSSVVFRAPQRPAETTTIIESPSGNSLLVNRIGPNSYNYGGFLVTSNGQNLGQVVIDQTSTVHIKNTNGVTDDLIEAITVTPSQEVIVTNNLTVQGERTQLDTNVFITSAVDIYNANTQSALTITHLSSTPIARFTSPSNNNSIVSIESLNKDSVLDFKSLSGSKITFTNVATNSSYFTVSITESLSSIVLFSSDNTDTLATVQSLTNKSILELKSLSGNVLYFTDAGNVVPYYTIRGNNQLSSITFESAANSTNLVVQSSTGSTTITNKIKDASASSNFLTQNVSGTQNYGQITVSGNKTMSFQIGDALTEAMRINSQGYLGINTSAPNKTLTVNGEISASNALTVSSTISSNNTVYAYGGNSTQWNSVYNTTLNTSGTWVSTYTSVSCASATWDTVVLRLPLSGGTVSGPVVVTYGPSDALTILGNVTIHGNLSSTGLQSFANTVFTTTSAISVVNNSSTTALYINSRGPGDIASFYDGDTGIEVLHVGGSTSLSPFVGVNTSSPNKEFTVNGEISANKTIYALEGNSSQWSSAYTTTLSSNIWNSAYTTVNAFSAGWSDTKIYEKSVASINLESDLSISLLDISLDHEIMQIHAEVPSITAIKNGLRGNTYTLTNKTTANINIVQTPQIFIRQGHSWRATNSTYLSSFLTLPVSGSCLVRANGGDTVSVW